MTEQSLGDLISRTVAAKLDSAFVEKEIDLRVGKLVEHAVDAALRSYSDAGKEIERAVTEALRVNRIDLPAYGDIVAKMLREQIDARVAELVAGKLKADMDELLSLAPKEIKLSEIAKLMLADERHGVDHGPAITVIVGDVNYTTRWLYLDETEHLEEHNQMKCRHRLLLHEDGTVASAVIGDRDLKRASWIGAMYGMEQRLRAYVACGTKIILDEDDVVIGVGDY